MQCPCGNFHDSNHRYCPSCKRLYMKLWRKEHKLSPVARAKSNARSYAHTYLKRGRIKREPCEIGFDCSGPVTMHHEDYSKPLHIRWLCKGHHDDVTFGRLSLIPSPNAVKISLAPTGFRQFKAHFLKTLHDAPRAPILPAEPFTARPSSVRKPAQSGDRIDPH